MANMSAAILRNIIGSLFQVEPRTIRLSGELAPDSSWQNRYWNGSLGSDENIYSIYGYSAIDGLVDISYIVGEFSGSNYAHTERTDRPGQPLYSIENVERFAFFVVHETGYSNWSGQEHSEWNNITVYSAPDFSKFKKNLEDYDIERWQNWVNENLTK